MYQKPLFIKNLDSDQLVDETTIETTELPKLKSEHWESFWDQLYQSHQALCTAAQNNDVEQLKVILSPEYNLPIDINMKLEEQWCCLHFASIEGNLDSSFILLQNGAKPDCVNIQKRTPLHIASMKGYLEVSKLLLQFQAKVDVQDYQDNTPLHLASQLGHGDIVQLLLENQADHKVRNHFNQSPYDLSYDRNIAKIFEDRSLYDSYQKKSFLGNPCGRSEHVMRLLMANCPSISAPQSSKFKISRIDIQQIGPQDFQVLQPLGKGSFGQVYLVKQRETNRQFAMKILNKAKIQQANITKYAQTEKKVLSIISCPFIVKLHYAFQTENKLYLILDYCPGGDLEQLMNERGALPEKVAKSFAVEILIAIECLHQNCIVYRDLKPSNVVIDTDGHACLTDFGLSKELKTKRTTSFCGSYAYLAPEMLEKAGHGFPIDWYLYGVFLYEMVTGKPPYYEKDRNALFSNIRFAKLPQPKNITPALWDLLQGLLDRNPSKRLGSKNDSLDLKSHPWFEGIDFEQALKRKLPVPKISKRNIDMEGDLKVTFSEQAQVDESRNYVDNWSFTA